MLELAEIFRRFGDEYRQRFAGGLLPSHRRAMDCIESCRTEALGGHLYPCDNCGHKHYEYHSCNHRACPKCGHGDADKWLEQNSEKLLDTHYFMVTFTIPQELRDWARSHQREFYKVLFQCSSDTLKQLAKSSNKIGNRLAMLAVLHTWTRVLVYHPHIHYLIAGGGLSEDGRKWKPSCKSYLFKVQIMSQVFRAKMRDAFREKGWGREVPDYVWKMDWSVNCQARGHGQGVLKYLSRYVFRTALSNKRIKKLHKRELTFSYLDSKTHKSSEVTYDIITFMHMFLQHVLPRGFVRVRYYGLFHHAQRKMLEQAMSLIGKTVAAILSRETVDPQVRACPKCKHTYLRVIKLDRIRAPPIAA